MIARTAMIRVFCDTFPEEKQHLVSLLRNELAHISQKEEVGNPCLSYFYYYILRMNLWGQYSKPPETPLYTPHLTVQCDVGFPGTWNWAKSETKALEGLWVTAQLIKREPWLSLLWLPGLREVRLVHREMKWISGISWLPDWVIIMTTIRYVNVWHHYQAVRTLREFLMPLWNFVELGICTSMGELKIIWNLNFHRSGTSWLVPSQIAHQKTQAVYTILHMIACKTFKSSMRTFLLFLFEWRKGEFLLPLSRQSLVHYTVHMSSPVCRHLHCDVAAGGECPITVADCSRWGVYVSEIGGVPGNLGSGFPCGWATEFFLSAVRGRTACGGVPFVRLWYSFMEKLEIITPA